MASPPDPGAVLARRADIVLGDLRRALWRLAWPAVVSAGLTAGFGIADTIFVGRGLGAVALAALSTGAFLLWSVDALSLAGAVGLTAVVARRVGEEDVARAAAATRQGVGLALAAGVAVALLAPFTELPFALMGVGPDVAREGASYLSVLFVGSGALFLFHTLAAALRGAGDTRTPLALLGAALLANVVLDPVLIFGWGPAPALGVAGAAGATVLSHAVAAALAVPALARAGLLGGSVRGPWRPRLSAWAEILRIGSPAAANGVFFCFVYLVLARITADWGTEALAALGVGHKGEAPCYFLAVGFAAAVAPLVGQSLGAGRPARAERAAWLAVRQASYFAAAWAAVLVLAPALVARVFSADAGVVRVASGYLVIVGLSQVFLAFEVVLDGAFAGAGDTVPPMLIGLPISAARVPLAWLLASPAGLGAHGIWIAISVTTIAKGLLLAAWFRRGGWKRHAAPRPSSA
jgi:putative MATE family efflux protein